MTVEDIPEEAEHIPGRPIAWTLGGTVLAIVACGVVVWALAAFQLVGGGPAPIAQQVDRVPPSVPFTMRAATPSDDLDRWTWSDRDHRRVRMPVDLAIDRYLAARGVR